MPLKIDGISTVLRCTGARRNSHSRVRLSVTIEWKAAAHALGKTAAFYDAVSHVRTHVEYI